MRVHPVFLLGSFTGGMEVWLISATGLRAQEIEMVMERGFVSVSLLCYEKFLNFRRRSPKESDL